MTEKYQADWSLAQKHSRTFSPGFVYCDVSSSVCPCCNEVIQKQQIPMCQNTKQLAILGPGFPLYFIFLKYSIIMIFLLLVSYSALTIFWAYEHNSNFCLKAISKMDKKGNAIYCTSWMILFSRLESKVDAYQNIIRMTSFITQLFFLVYIREQLRKYNAYFHQRQQPKISDYSILVKMIPKQQKIQFKLKKLFQQAFGGKYQIQHIYPIALEKPNNKFLQIEELKKKYMKIIAQQRYDQQAAKHIALQINNLSRKNKMEAQDWKDKALKDQIICEKAIVTLSTQLEKQEILKETIKQEVKLQIFGEHQNLQFVAAPQPNQIIWMNINISRNEKVKCLIVGWILFIGILGIITTFFYFILMFKAEQVKKSMQIYKTNPQGAVNLKKQALVIVLVCILSIVLFNKLLLSKLLQLITQIQRHKTAAAFQLSLSIKYALGLVFTTAILTLLVQNLKLHNIYQHDFGVIEEQTIMYFFSAFFVPFIWFCNPWYIFKRIKIYFAQNSTSLTQRQANDIMELPEYSIGKRYGQIIEIIWFTYFYASLIPIGAGLSLIGACLFYWVDKYNLLRKSSIKTNISGDLSMNALVMLDFSLVLKPVGQIVFDIQIRDTCTSQSILLTIVGLLYIVCPKDHFLNWINGENFNLNKQSYKQIENSKLLAYSKLNANKMSSYDMVRDYEEIKINQESTTFSHLNKEAIGRVNNPNQCPEEINT